MKKFVEKCVIILFCMLSINNFAVYAADSGESIYSQDTLEFDVLDEIDDTQINEMLSEMFAQKMDFKVMVMQLLNGEKKLDADSLLELVKTVFLYQLDENKKSLVTVFLLCVMAALFTNFTKVLDKGSVAQIGFYILFLLLIAVLLRSFSVTYEIASSLLNQMTRFMKVLLPAFFVTIIAAKGANTALIFYQIILVSIYMVETLLLKFVLPLCNVYVVINLINQISKEDLFSKMGELLKNIIVWAVKWLFAFVMGINAVHSIIAPAVDQFKNSVFSKTISAIPGIGSTMGGISDVVIGSGVLIKNGVGTAILILLFLLILTPMVKLFCCMLMYKLTAALIQPVSDKRMINMVDAVSLGTGLLIKCVSSVAALFFLTMAVLTVAAG